MKKGIIRMSDNQKKALELISDEWATSHPRISSQTLLSLESRDLIERKCLDLWTACIAHMPYTSHFYLWRKKETTP